MNAALHLVAERQTWPLAAVAPRPPRWHLLLSAASSAHAALAVQTVVQLHGVEIAGLQRYTDSVSGWHHCRSEIDDTRACLSAEDLRRTTAPLSRLTFPSYSAWPPRTVLTRGAGSHACAGRDCAHEKDGATCTRGAPQNMTGVTSRRKFTHQQPWRL